MCVECAHFLLLRPIRTAGSHHIPLGFKSHHECVREVEPFECCVCVCVLSVIEFCGSVVKDWSSHVLRVQNILILLYLFYRTATLDHIKGVSPAKWKDFTN